MLIPYAYNPAIHDLFLYEDHVVTWTQPTAGSSNVKRPYAWNPNSLLYGYRKSLTGMLAIYRTMQTVSPYSSYGANSAANPVNDPVFKNTYVIVKAYFFTQRLAMQCRHWQQSLVYRNPNYSFADNYLTGGKFLAEGLVRFIDHDDVITDWTANDLLFLYQQVAPAFGNAFAVSGTNTNADLAMIEAKQDIPVAPMIIADSRTVPVDAPAYVIDSNQKIIACSALTTYGTQQNLVVVSKAVANAPFVTAFLHDSGSVLLMELRPPTSAAAGDGIMGLIPKSLEGASDLIGTAAVYGSTGIGLIFPENHANAAQVLYQQSLGFSWPPASGYERQTNEAIATESTQQQIISAINQIG